MNRKVIRICDENLRNGLIAIRQEQICRRSIPTERELFLRRKPYLDFYQYCMSMGGLQDEPA